MQGENKHSNPIFLIQFFQSPKYIRLSILSSLKKNLDITSFQGI